MSNDDLFTEKFWERVWSDFFEDFTQPDFWKNNPGAAALLDLKLDGEGNFLQIDGRPHVVMMLKKVLIQKDRKEGEAVKFSLLKSPVVEETLKRYDLHALHQSAVENVRWAHQQKEEAVETPVPPLLLAALIQYWQMSEAAKTRFAREIEKIKELYDEHTVPGTDSPSYGSKPYIIHSETGRMSSQRPNEANKPSFRLISSETGRFTSDKSLVEQSEKGENNDD